MPLPECCFIGGRVYERKVKLNDGNEHTLHFLGLMNPEVLKFGFGAEAEDPDKKAAVMAKFVSMTFCEPDGTLSLSFERACSIDLESLQSIFIAAREVNGVKDKGK